MKPHILLILIASVVVVNSQNFYPRKYPMHDLCKTMGDEKYPSGMVILNPNVVAIEMPPYPQKAPENRIEGMVRVQVVVNQNGEVVTATPVLGFEHHWAASVKASVTARFDPQWLSRQTGDVAGILLFNFTKGQVKLVQLPTRPEKGGPTKKPSSTIVGPKDRP
jgi:hypothetical protein